MARETWTIDGYDLTQGTLRDVEFRAGLYQTPAGEGDDANVANRSGRIWRPKVHGPGQFSLALWWGNEVSRDAVELQWEEMQRAFVHLHRQSRFVRRLSDNTLRECDGDCSAALDPTPIGQRGMRAAFNVSIPAAFWRGDTDKSVVSPTGTGANVSVDVALTPHARSTAPLEGLRYTFVGPASNPKVQDVTDGALGESWRYAGTIPAGGTLVLDSATYQSSSTGFVHNPAAVNFDGRRFLVVPAAKVGATPTVRVTAQNTTAATQLTVTGREAFLT